LIPALDFSMTTKSSFPPLRSLLMPDNTTPGCF
jgi:hypothetical protein